MAAPRKDLTGQKFGYLTVLECTEKRAVRPCGKVSGFIWRCQCECGNIIEVEGTRLTSGNKQSCGCHHYETVSQKLRHDDLTGQKFGMLTVIKWIPVHEREPKRKSYPYMCRCDCGNITYAKFNDLKTGNKKSCGCYHDKYSHSRKITHQSHNSSYTRLYHIWQTMKDRCTNPNNKSAERYCNRGITLCDEWFDFETFKKWAYENGYDENAPRNKCTIERVNNDKGYSPDNCIWADCKIQRRNTSRTKFYEYKGEKHIITDWAKILGIKYYSLYHAIQEKGMTIEEYVTKYINKKES